MLWDIATCAELAQLDHKGATRSLAFSHDSKMLASGSNDYTVKLWDVATGKEQAILAGHEHSVRGLAFSPDDKTLVTGRMGTTVRLWDVSTGKETRILE